MFAFNIKAVDASETITIMSDGTIDPTTAPIVRDGDLYTFTADIYDSIVVARDNITVDGTGYTLEGPGGPSPPGIDLTGAHNVTIKNMQITSFWYGILLWESSNITISKNNIIDNTAMGIAATSYNRNPIV